MQLPAAMDPATMHVSQWRRPPSQSVRKSAAPPLPRVGVRFGDEVRYRLTRKGVAGAAQDSNQKTVQFGGLRSQASINRVGRAPIGYLIELCENARPPDSTFARAPAISTLTTNRASRQYTS
jgi:hypothetical protein